MQYPKIARAAAVVLLLLLQMQFTLKGQNAAVSSTYNLEGALWIAAREETDLADSLLYGDHPAPLFRKDFSVTGKLQKATLTITAAGYYLASLNGKLIENNVLDPAWTNFSKRIYFSNYDVTTLLNNGSNTIGVRLGNGFYNLLPLRLFGRRNLRKDLPTGEPRFIATLLLTYTDGRAEKISSDMSWKTMEGPVIKNNVYLGEFYDARRELPGWDQPGYNDRAWKKPWLIQGPGGTLYEAFFPGISITKQYVPVDIRRIGNATMADMGVNLTGLYRIKMRGKLGDTIRFRFGERLYENGSLNPMTTVAGQIKRKGSGGPGAPDIAWQTDSYVFGNEKEITWQPRFTFHTFRYMEITGLNYLPSKEDIQALLFHTDVLNQNAFTCSSPLLNDIQTITRLTFLDNLISVQSDCPAREKFGYGGDLNATSESFICNFDMQAFYRKTIYDWVDAMKDSIFIDTAPYVGINYCGISWESAFLITQYKLFQYYGDSAIVDELYQKDLEWMAKVERLHPNGIVDKGLSDHESMVKVPVQLIGTTHYLDCARIMKRFAAVKNDPANSRKFDELEKLLTRKLLDQFWYKPVPGPINRQTLFATLIYYGLIPQKELPAAADSLLKAVKSEPAGHFTTGIFGTKYILEALSMTGHADEVYKIVNSTAYPGWGHMVDRGATTLWETWKESDNTYSNCHPMFGTVTEWYFRWLAGVRPLADYPGFRKFLVAPFFPAGLNHAEAVYHTPSGDIKVAWTRDEGGKIELSLTVPKGCSALFAPTGNAQKIWKVTNVNTKFSFNSKPESPLIELGEGDYLIR